MLPYRIIYHILLFAHLHCCSLVNQNDRIGLVQRFEEFSRVCSKSSGPERSLVIRGYDSFVRLHDIHGNGSLLAYITRGWVGVWRMAKGDSGMDIPIWHQVYPSPGNESTWGENIIAPITVLNDDRVLILVPAIKGDLALPSQQDLQALAVNNIAFPTGSTSHYCIHTITFDTRRNKRERSPSVSFKGFKMLRLTECSKSPRQASQD